MLKEQLEQAAPSWVAAVEHAAAAEDFVLLLTVYAFVNEPELLRDALLFAYESGVKVTFVPETFVPETKVVA